MERSVIFKNLLPVFVFSLLSAIPAYPSVSTDDGENPQDTVVKKGSSCPAGLYHIKACDCKA